MSLWALGETGSKWRNNGRSSRLKLYPRAAPGTDIFKDKMQYVLMHGVISLSKCEYVVVFRLWIFSHVTGNVSFWSVCKQVYMRTLGCACK